MSGFLCYMCGNKFTKLSGAYHDGIISLCSYCWHITEGIIHNDSNRHIGWPQVGEENPFWPWKDMLPGKNYQQAIRHMAKIIKEDPDILYSL